MKALIALFTLIRIPELALAGEVRFSKPFDGCGLLYPRVEPIMFVAKVPNQSDFYFALSDVDPRTERLVEEAAVLIAQLMTRKQQFVCLKGTVHNVDGKHELVPVAVTRK